MTLLGDLATLFPYTLPAVIWLPLNLLSSTAAAQARFYENPGSSRIHDPASEVSKNFKGNALKQKRNTRWSVGDMGRTERNITADRLDQPLRITQSISNTSDLFYLEKLRRRPVENIQETTSSDEQEVTDTFLQVPVIAILST